MSSSNPCSTPKSRLSSVYEMMQRSAIPRARDGSSRSAGHCGDKTMSPSSNSLSRFTCSSRSAWLANTPVRMSSRSTNPRHSYTLAAVSKQGSSKVGIHVLRGTLRSCAAAARRAGRRRPRPCEPCTPSKLSPAVAAWSRWSASVPAVGDVLVGGG